MPEPKPSDEINASESQKFPKNQFHLKKMITVLK